MQKSSVSIGKRTTNEDDRQCAGRVILVRHHHEVGNWMTPREVKRARPVAPGMRTILEEGAVSAEVWKLEVSDTPEPQEGPAREQDRVRMELGGACGAGIWILTLASAPSEMRSHWRNEQGSDMIQLLF